MSPRHPAKRAQARQIVADSIDLAYWWEGERAAAAKDRAVTRLLHTASWCLAAITAVVLVVFLVDQIGAR